MQQKQNKTDPCLRQLLPNKVKSVIKDHNDYKCMFVLGCVGRSTLDNQFNKSLKGKKSHFKGLLYF